jgi:4-hydroxy-3-methylbut-2-enyl diphosphate reductase IspH
MRIILANPRGFCAGVERAIGIVERALELLVRLSMCAMLLYTTST